MRKILWLDINSSYSHTSVALPAIEAQMDSEAMGWEWCVVRGTINDSPGVIAAAVAECRPDVIAATFWLFNHRMQIEVLSRAVQLLDDVKVVCGGPEFLGCNHNFLKINPFVTAVVRGEGERALPEFLAVIDTPAAWNGIGGLCWISDEDQNYYDNGVARVADFESLKFPEQSKFFNWEKPFVQLETTRGCFNTCAFCVSGGEKPVRYQSLEQVASRLEDICNKGIKDVRVLDRTFNYDTRRACQMLDLFAMYQGRMRFHLEIHPSLMSQELKDKIASLPVGLLHLEAGIQSLDEGVLNECGRKGNLKSSLEGLRYLAGLENVETHADLIAGLPLYRLDMLCRDIVTLVEMGVDELQIESLKLLPGTRMREMALEKGLRYSPLPPYEVMATPAMTTSDLRFAMNISRMIDFYYNALAWQSVIRKLIVERDGFLSDFTGYLKRIGVLDSPLSLERRGVILYEYVLEYCPEMVADISLAWIEGGFSLKKSPAGEVVKVKDIRGYLSGKESCMSVVYGEVNEAYRYYLYSVPYFDAVSSRCSAAVRSVIFGFCEEGVLKRPVVRVDFSDLIF